MELKIDMKDNQDKLDEILDRYGSVTDIAYAVGIFSEDNPEEAKKGILNEKGTSKSPSRPFVEPTAISNEKFITQQIKKKLRKNESPETTLSIIADNLVGKVQGRIRGQKFKKLAPSTIKRKGHDTKLIETGEMYNAIKKKKIK